MAIEQKPKPETDPAKPQPAVGSEQVRQVDQEVQKEAAEERKKQGGYD
jgi:hypothetical protein